jgi:hypothetical protein
MWTFSKDYHELIIDNIKLFLLTRLLIKFQVAIEDFFCFGNVCIQLHVFTKALGYFTKFRFP